MRVLLLTGASGQLGNNLALRVLRNGQSVHGVDRPSRDGDREHVSEGETGDIGHAYTQTTASGA